MVEATILLPAELLTPAEAGLAAAEATPLVHPPSRAQAGSVEAEALHQGIRALAQAGSVEAEAVRLDLLWEVQAATEAAAVEVLAAVARVVPQ